MKSIDHIGPNQVDWFTRCADIFAIRQPLAIIRQEAFAADFRRLLEKIGIDPADVPRDVEVRVHANDYRGIPTLSDLAQANLRQWYSQDFAFYACCVEWIESQSKPRKPSPTSPVPARRVQGVRNSTKGFEPTSDKSRS